MGRALSWYGDPSGMPATCRLKAHEGVVDSGLTCMQVSWRLLCADPLRVLRAIRFGARFGFRLDEELEHAAASDLVSHPPACTSWKHLMQSQDHWQSSIMVSIRQTASVPLLLQGPRVTVILFSSYCFGAVYLHCFPSGQSQCWLRAAPLYGFLVDLPGQAA